MNLAKEWPPQVKLFESENLIVLDVAAFEREVFFLVFSGEEPPCPGDVPLFSYAANPQFGPLGPLQIEKDMWPSFRKGRHTYALSKSLLCYEPWQPALPAEPESPRFAAGQVWRLKKGFYVGCGDVGVEYALVERVENTHLAHWLLRCAPCETRGVSTRVLYEQYAAEHWEFVRAPNAGGPEASGEPKAKPPRRFAAGQVWLLSERCGGARNGVYTLERRHSEGYWSVKRDGLPAPNVALWEHMRDGWSFVSEREGVPPPNHAEADVRRAEYWEPADNFQAISKVWAGHYSRRTDPDDAYASTHVALMCQMNSLYGKFPPAARANAARLQAEELAKRLGEERALLAAVEEALAAAPPAHYKTAAGFVDWARWRAFVGAAFEDVKTKMRAGVIPEDLAQWGKDNYAKSGFDYAREVFERKIEKERAAPAPPRVYYCDTDDLSALGTVSGTFVVRAHAPKAGPSCPLLALAAKRRGK